MAFRTQRDLDRLTLPPDKAEVFHFDGRCPGCASVSSATASRPSSSGIPRRGKRKRITLGAVAGLDLDRRGGRQPRSSTPPATVATRVGAQAGAAAPPPTVHVGDLIGAYLREHAERHQRPRTLIETRRALERHWAPLHGLPAADVTRRDVSARLIELARSTGPVGANRARAHLSGASRGRSGRARRPQPVFGTIRSEERSRERVLSPAELRAIWQATAD